MLLGAAVPGGGGTVVLIGGGVMLLGAAVSGGGGTVVLIGGGDMLLGSSVPLCASIGWLATHRAAVSANTGNMIDKASCVFFIAFSLGGI